MERLCPTCNAVLKYEANHWHCQQCQANYRLRGLCNTCGAELERLAACGASNWFCPKCNELKSKAAIQTELISI